MNEEHDPVRYLKEDISKWSKEDQRLAGFTTDGWYFWDETWANCYGPYESEQLARDNLKKYCEEVLDFRLKVDKQCYDTYMKDFLK